MYEEWLTAWENGGAQQEDDITIINPSQPYTFKDDHYTVIGAPMLVNEVPQDPE